MIWFLQNISIFFQHWELHGFLLTLNLRGSKQYVWKIDMANLRIFPYFFRTK